MANVRSNPLTAMSEWRKNKPIELIDQIDTINASDTTEETVQDLQAQLEKYLAKGNTIKEKLVEQQGIEINELNKKIDEAIAKEMESSEELQEKKTLIKENTKILEENKEQQFTIDELAVATQKASDQKDEAWNKLKDFKENNPNKKSSKEYIELFNNHQQAVTKYETAIDMEENRRKEHNNNLANTNKTIESANKIIEDETRACDAIIDTIKKNVNDKYDVNTQQSSIKTKYNVKQMDDDFLQITNLNKKLNDTITSIKGFNQKLAPLLALCEEQLLILDEKLLILDEKISKIDPKEKAEIIFRSEDDNKEKTSNIQSQTNSTSTRISYLEKRKALLEDAINQLQETTKTPSNKLNMIQKVINNGELFKETHYSDDSHFQKIKKNFIDFLKSFKFIKNKPSTKIGEKINTQKEIFIEKFSTQQQEISTHYATLFSDTENKDKTTKQLEKENTNKSANVKKFN